MPRLREGVQPTKAEVALFEELKKVQTTWPAELPDGTGPKTWPLVAIEAAYRAPRVARSATEAVEVHDQAGTLTRADLALEGLLHACATDDVAALRQALLEHAALVVTWVEAIDHR
jgi:hypothetical protein